MKTKKLTLMAILTALAMILSYIERFIPLQMLIPLPGIKLGLANTVTLFALYMLDIPSAFLILTVRCLLGALFAGSVTSLLFSITGGLLSMLLMSLAKNVKGLSIYGISVLGAAMHNLGQIITASVLMHSSGVFGYLPYLLLIGIACGWATGTVTGRVIQITGKSLIIKRR